MEQTIHKCNSCFYKYYDKDREHPCKLCDNYNKYVNRNVYINSNVPDFKPLTQAVKTWDFDDAFDEFKDHGGGSTLEDYPELVSDAVNAPKHYMLISHADVMVYEKEGKGIEVRNVIEALVNKLCPFNDGMFVADYVQTMQYLMRFMEKNGKEDLEKAQWYLNKMIEAYE